LDKTIESKIVPITNPDLMVKEFRENGRFLRMGNRYLQIKKTIYDCEKNYRYWKQPKSKRV